MVNKRLLRTLMLWGAVVVGYNVYNYKYVKIRQDQHKVQVDQYSGEWAALQGKHGDGDGK